MKGHRKEMDSLGAVWVPQEALWGAQTQRCIQNFSIGNEKMPSELIEAYAYIKMAAAHANADLGCLSSQKLRLIEKVCQEILEGQHHQAFPLHVWMTGSGTQFNMNVNEVIANRASELSNQPLGSKKPLHPNDDVNASQSSNDTFPTAMHIATYLALKRRLLPVLKNLHKQLQKKAKHWHSIVKIGRTHLQDATPLTLGQEFSAYASLILDNMEAICHASQALLNLPLGGTAVGTGLNTPKGFDQKACAYLKRSLKIPFKSASNKFALMGSHLPFDQLSGQLKALAATLYKIACDIRLLGCGPRGGIHELLLPCNEPGSSIMPGKANPTLCEALTMVALQVIGNDAALTFADASGHLQLNVYKPLIIQSTLQSIRLLADGCEAFDRGLLAHLKPNKKKISEHVQASLMLITALTPHIGYDQAAKIAKLAEKEDLTLKQAAHKLNLFSDADFDQWVNPLQMCHPS
jgi:fumarate hydratase class II